MNLEYRISFDDFRSLCSPFKRRERGTGFQMVVASCGATAFIGLMMIESALWAGVYPLLLGIAGLTGCYLYETRSIAQEKRKYDQDVLRAYATTHCIDGRKFETHDDGYTLICKCGTVTRLWTGLVSLSENGAVFSLVAKTDSQIIPKSAFSSEGRITEFRALISNKLNLDRPFTAHYIEYTQTPIDLRAGWKLNLLQGGGWRRLGRAAIIFAAILFWGVAHASDSVWIPVGVVLGIFGLAGLGLAVQFRRFNRYWGPLRVYFSEDGLYLHDPVSEVRSGWKEFLGYLEDSKVFLLYRNPRLYRIVPKRALSELGSSFGDLVRRKLPRYNYREPHASVMRTPGTASGSSTPGSLFS